MTVKRSKWVTDITKPGRYTVSDGFSCGVHYVTARDGWDAVNQVKDSFRQQDISLRGRGRNFTITNYHPTTPEGGAK